MLNHFKSQCLLLVATTFALGGCAEPGVSETDNLEICKDPRPEICTLEYDPVCGVLEDGGRRQFSNGCSACAEPAVTGFLPGPCPDDGDQQ